MRLVVQLTYLVAEDASDNVATQGRQIQFHPRYHGYARPELVRVALPGGLELGAYADGDLRAQTYSDAANLQPMYTRVLLGAGVSVGRPRNHVRLTASAANLTDARQADVSNWSLPGRSVFFALAYAPIGGRRRSGRHRIRPLAWNVN